MNAKQERALAGFVISKLWPAKIKKPSGTFRRDWLFENKLADAELTFEVMRRMKKRGYVYHGESTWQNWYAQFQHPSIKGGFGESWHKSRPEIAIMLAAKQALEGK